MAVLKSLASQHWTTLVANPYDFYNHCSFKTSVAQPLNYPELTK